MILFFIYWVISIITGVVLMNFFFRPFAHMSWGVDFPLFLAVFFLTFFDTFGRPICLGGAVLLNVFDILASFGIFLGANIKNWPNFHFKVFSRGSKMAKISEIPISGHFRGGQSG